MRFRIHGYLIAIFLFIAFHGIGWAQLVPVEQIPKLSMFGQSVDYRETLRAGVLVPERIEFEGASAWVNQLEPALQKALGQDFTVFEDEKFRTREEQWAYLRNLSSKHNDSMHYYRIQHIYYDLQLSGWFKVYEWQYSDLKLHLYIVRPDESKTPRVWLIHIICDPTEKENVSFSQSKSMVLSRRGKCEVRWDVKVNTATISQYSD